MSGPQVKVFVADGALQIDFPYNAGDNERVKALPERRFVKGTKRWTAPVNLASFKALREQFGARLLLSEKARAALSEAEQGVAVREATLAARKSGEIDTSPWDHFPFGGTPYAHQKRALALGAHLPAFGYFMDQGTGKTFTAIQDASMNFLAGAIDRVLVICPNCVKTNWANYADSTDPEGWSEFRRFRSPSIRLNEGVWYSACNAEQRKRWTRFWSRQAEPEAGRLDVLSVNVEALHVDRVFRTAYDFLAGGKGMVIIDESTRIKTRNSTRSKAVADLREVALRRRILSGTPIIKSPLDAWSQLQFLDPDSLPFGSYHAFQRHFAVMGGYKDRQVILYRNQHELADYIASISYRVTKEECLDLPPKVYIKNRVELSDAQKDAYRRIRDEALIILDRETKEIREADEYDPARDDAILTKIVLAQIVRLQEITAGYLPVIEENEDGKKQRVGSHELVKPASNPKFARALELIEEAGDQKVIVWSQFTSELEGFLALLASEGIRYVRFDGKVSEKDRDAAIRSFKEDAGVRVFVGNPAAGGIGINLQEATVVIYLSNDFSPETRLQSEDRAHRIGQRKSVTYYDVLGIGTSDSRILSVLRANRAVSDAIMRDGWREWI